MLLVSKEYLTVSALTKYLHTKFTRDPYLRRVYLTGEISNFRRRATHQYFSLKDDNAVISVMMFQSAFSKIKFEPEEGMKVLVSGRVDLYEKSGRYQIIIDTMQPDGVGALYQAYEQLVKKLRIEGLFNEELKKPLVKYPKRIAVITSPSGAVIRDIITTTRRRYPIAQLVLFPAVVQGDDAADSLVGRLKQVNEDGNFDTIIIGRGGGSIEDLWPFNEEKVARAISDSKIPVISSVGHETDTTIADLVADVRAATPTAAAELATPVLSEEIVKIKQYRLRIIQVLKNKIYNYQQILDKVCSSYILQQPDRLYTGYAQNLDSLINRKNQAFKNLVYKNEKQLQLLESNLQHNNPSIRIKDEKNNLQQLLEKMHLGMLGVFNDKSYKLEKLMSSLDMLSPLKVMNRGYSYILKDGKTVKNVKSLQPNDDVTLYFENGSAEARITKIREEKE